MSTRWSWCGGDFWGQAGPGPWVWFASPVSPLALQSSCWVRPPVGENGSSWEGSVSLPSCSASASPSFRLPTLSFSLPHLSATGGWGPRVHEGGHAKVGSAYPLPLLTATPSRLAELRGSGHKSSTRGCQLCLGLKGPALRIRPAPGLPGWRDWSEVFPHGLDHSSSPNPEPRTNSNSSVKQQPDGSRCFLQDSTLFINQPQSYQRTNGIAGREEKLDELYKQCTDK